MASLVIEPFPSRLTTVSLPNSRQLQSLEERLAEASQRCLNLETAKEAWTVALDRRLDELEAGAKDSQGAVLKELQRTADSLEASMGELRGEAESWAVQSDEQLQEHVAEVSGLKRTVAALERRLSAAEAEAVEREAQAASALEDLERRAAEEREAAAAALEQRLAALERDLAEQRQAVPKLTEHIDSVARTQTAELEACRAELAQGHEEISEALDERLQQWTKTISAGHEEISKALDEQLEELQEQIQSCATASLEARMAALDRAFGSTQQRVEEVTEAMSSMPKTSRILEFEERIAGVIAIVRKKVDAEGFERTMADVRGELQVVASEVQEQGRRILECQLLSREASLGGGSGAGAASATPLSEAVSLTENCRVLKQYVEQCRESIGIKIAQQQEQLASLVLRVGQVEAEFAMAEELEPIRSHVTELQTSMIDMVTCLDTRVDRKRFEQLEALVDGSLGIGSVDGRSRAGSVQGAVDVKMLEERLKELKRSSRKELHDCFNEVVSKLDAKIAEKLDSKCDSASWKAVDDQLLARRERKLESQGIDERIRNHAEIVKLKEDVKGVARQVKALRAEGRPSSKSRQASAGPTERGRAGPPAAGPDGFKALKARGRQASPDARS